jgi:hypothetical protein
MSANKRINTLNCRYYLYCLHTMSCRTSIPQHIREAASKLYEDLKKTKKKRQYWGEITEAINKEYGTNYTPLQLKNQVTSYRVQLYSCVFLFNIFAERTSQKWKQHMYLLLQI